MTFFKRKCSFQPSESFPTNKRNNIEKKKNLCSPFFSSKPTLINLLGVHCHISFSWQQSKKTWICRKSSKLQDKWKKKGRSETFTCHSMLTYKIVTHKCVKQKILWTYLIHFSRHFICRLQTKWSFWSLWGNFSKYNYT